jgi:hypothetical protein
MLSPESDAWLEAFSLRAYLPMIRLAAGYDRYFLSDSVSANAARSYRRRQRTLLREYLQALTSDFKRLLGIASARDRTPMAYRDTQLDFIFGVLWIETRLASEALVPMAIEVRPLLESVEVVVRSARLLPKPRLRLLTS